MRLIRITFLLILIFGAFPTLGFSQTKQADSLKNELQTHQEKDSMRVNLLNDFALETYRVDTTTTKRTLLEAENIADSIGFTKGKAKSLYIKGNTVTSQFNFKEGIVYFNEALLLYKILDDKIMMSKCHEKIGLNWFQEFEYEKAILNFKKSIEINQSIGNAAGTNMALKYIGYAYSDLENFDEALIFYNKALEINKKYKNDKEIASCLNNIGILYDDQTNFHLSLKYHNESLEISKKINDSVAINKSYNNIGSAYQGNENYEKALENYEKSLLIQRKIGNLDNVAGALNNIGNIHKKLGNFSKALEYINEALIKGREVNNKETISTCLNNIGDVYLIMGENELSYKYYMEGMKLKKEIKNQFGLCRSYLGLAYILVNQNKYEDALVYTKKAKMITHTLEIKGLESNVYDLFTKIYSNTGNYKKAYESHKQFKLVNDTLYSRENIEKIAQLESEYKFKQALDSASIRELKLKKTVTATNEDLEKSKRNYLLAIIGILLTSILLGGVIFYLKYRNIKSKTDNIIIEQKLLRSQMTPHFIFNSLSVLQGMILNKEEKKSVLYLSKFSKLLRIILENSRDKMVLLSQELAAIDNYLALQNLENESYSYSVSVEKNLDVPLFEIPPMLIQPFVENAIEHAFVNQNKSRIIKVKLTYVNKKLICNITDNGIGINASKGSTKKNKSSLATTITSERLKILAKDLKMEGSVTIEDRAMYNEQGTTVTLVIPHKKNNVQSA